MELATPSCATSRPIGYRLRNLEAECKFSRALSLEALEAVNHKPAQQVSGGWPPHQDTPILATAGE